jgi:integrase
MPIAEARVRAREIIRRVRDGLPAIEPRGDTFAAAAAEYLARHVRKKGLRSAAEIERLLDKHILPKWGDREFESIRRSDITALLDNIEDNRGGRTGDYCLAVIRGLMNWAAARRDDYAPPIVRGMRRQSPNEQARSRILTDGEIRAVWAAADQCGAFGAMVKVSLLTAQRREKVVSMRWADIEGGMWAIPAQAREKTAAGTLALPDMARRVIEAQPRFAGNPFVFVARGQGPINGFSKMKVKLDRLSGVSDWVVHDLRRTARSLMSRAGVSSEHAERVLGHALVGVEQTYDRHAYSTEKAAALNRLATLLDGIIHERTADVIPMRKGQQ